MTAKEFRLGNLISVLGNVVEVIKIYGDIKIEVHSDILQFWEVDIEEKDEDVLPIPLTEEWLLKFGFKRLESPAPEIHPYADYIKYDIVISMPYFEFSYSYGDSSRVLKYVHELMNLYYTLTGEELEIK